MTTLTMLICLFMFFWAPVLAQTDISTKKQNAPDNIEQKDSILISSLINTRIVLKDGSIKKHCKLKEIREYWIVYEKDGSLHDLLIEKIKRIEIDNGTLKAIFFDDKYQPTIGQIK